jgi:hypothetical protein
MFYRTSCIVYHTSQRDGKTCLVVTKVFAQARRATEFFIRMEKIFFMIIRVKPVYFNLFGGFTTFDCGNGSSHLCQLCIFF